MCIDSFLWFYIERDSNKFSETENVSFETKPVIFWEILLWSDVGCHLWAIDACT